MKKLAFILVISLLQLKSFTQSQAETFIQEAQAYLANKDYRQAQLSLQDAINDLNNIMAAQLAASLPQVINGLNSTGEDNVNTAGMGLLGGGMQISKMYKHPSKAGNEADVQIVANSPLMSMMGMYMNNPAMLGQGAKSVRIGTTRAVLKTEMQDHYMDDGSSKQIRVSEVQIPLTQTLITLNLRGFATEAEELSFAGNLGIDKIRTALGE